MDGGSLAFDKENQVVSVWRREGNLFVSKEGIAQETKISDGRNASISAGQQAISVVWHQQGKIYVNIPQHSETQLIGEGRYPIIKTINNKESFTIWENQGDIYGKLLN
jgi:hypothetical protein